MFGEGNGTPLQYSCLENPMDGGAWWATVHGVAESWTRLSDFTFPFHFHALEKEMATHSSILAWRIPWAGAWKAIVYVAKSQTQLSDWVRSTHRTWRTFCSIGERAGIVKVSFNRLKETFFESDNCQKSSLRDKSSQVKNCISTTMPQQWGVMSTWVLGFRIRMYCTEKKVSSVAISVSRVTGSVVYIFSLV